ncbi:ADP-ribosylation [Aaosphaeria arxii CBS 175.79]|uniref:ADP-ribosylation n=1 Tax=Aaosphaeria arxii CBS 175.79 TaxID=1450172 RepID=A0A6A5Y3X9_9PLEO|nr:ADP-ribosylation [Aaosphaeria arxii CBS 175.79]KAF2019966.1 ADP-ribosylation [Aaosphaeria arxii CBS 175.79]
MLYFTLLLLLETFITFSNAGLIRPKPRIDVGRWVDPITHEPSSERPDKVTEVWRGDRRSPSEIAPANGFQLKDGTPNDSLYRHILGEVPTQDVLYPESVGEVSGYVATSFLKEAGEEILKGFNNGGYLYKIKTSHNFVDTQKTLKQYNKYPVQLEFAAKGGIPMDQIIGWCSFPGRQSRARVPGPFVKNDDSFYAEHLLEPTNRTFNSEKYKGQTDGGAQYDLAGFPKDFPAWTESPWKDFAQKLLQRSTKSMQ